MIKIFNLTVGCLLFANTLSGQVKSKQTEVYDKIVRANLHHPDIVLRQAVHESRNFKSPAAKNKNNIFGIMKGRRTRYFASIDDCIVYYREHIQSRYTEGNYYKFLTRIGYASDPRYINKLKNTIVYIE